MATQTRLQLTLNFEDASSRRCLFSRDQHECLPLYWQGIVCLQNLNILTVGAKDGKGGFFPEGIAGRINTPEGFDALSEGIEAWDGKAEAIQVSQCSLPSVVSCTCLL